MSQHTTTWFGCAPDTETHPEVAARALVLRRAVTRQHVARGGSLLDPQSTAAAVTQAFKDLVGVIAMTRDASETARAARRVQVVDDLDQQYRQLGEDPKHAIACAERIRQLQYRREQEWNALLAAIEAIPCLAWAA